MRQRRRLVIGCLSLAAIGLSCTESGVGESATKCVPKGPDEMCMEVTYLGDKQAKLEVTWDYSQDIVVDDVLISEVVWSAVVDCEEESGSLQDVLLRDALGSEVFISQESLSSVWLGIQNDQIDVIAPQACEGV